MVCWQTRKGGLKFEYYLANKQRRPEVLILVGEDSKDPREDSHSWLTLISSSTYSWLARLCLCIRLYICTRDIGEGPNKPLIYD